MPPSIACEITSVQRVLICTRSLVDCSVTSSRVYFTYPSSSGRHKELQMKDAVRDSSTQLRMPGRYSFKGSALYAKILLNQAPTATAELRTASLTTKLRETTQRNRLHSAPSIVPRPQRQEAQSLQRWLIKSPPRAAPLLLRPFSTSGIGARRRLLHCRIDVYHSVGHPVLRWQPRSMRMPLNPV